MKHIFLNLKRFDIPREYGGVNGVAPMEEWGSYIVQNIQKKLKAYGAEDVEFVIYFPEAHLIPAVKALCEDSPVKIGCQGVYRDDTAENGNFGAFTTNRTANAAKAMGCSSVIIGHCEERKDKAGILKEAGVTDEGAVGRLLNQEIKAAIQAGLTVLYCIGETDGEQEQWQEVLYWVIIASITIANLFALRQQNLKRLMAFSSISQAGYIMLGVISGSAQGMTSLVYYVLIYMFANLAVFTVITIVALRAGKFTLEDYNGLYTTNPKLAFLMTLALFSLAGIPPFAGFFSKFFIFAAAFEGGFHLLVFIALINTIISLYYYLKIVKAMYINKSDEPIAAFRSDNYTRASLAICTLGIVVLSIASVVYQSIDKFSFGL